MVRYILKGLGTLMIICSVQAADRVFAADVELNIGVGGMPVFVTNSVSSMTDLRTSHVQLQERDYSCGAASMTSIFKYYLESPVTEIEVIQGLFDIAKEKGTLETIIRRRGFTLLDLKRFAESRGFKTSAFKLEFDDLVKLGEPAIVPIIPGGFKHFVAFRGADDKYVYLADPSYGNLTETIADFKRDWYAFTNVALVVHRKEGQDKDHVPPLMVSEKERFDPQSSVDSFVHTEPVRGPLVRTEW